MLEQGADALERGRRLMRSHASRRRELEKELESVWTSLEKVSVAFVETLEHFRGLLEMTDQKGVDDLFRLAVRQAMERLEDSGVGLDGAVGESFDPKKHRAIEDLTTSERGDLRVVRLLSQGITCADRRFKPAHVVVQREPAQE